MLCFTLLMADVNFILARHETPDRLFYAVIDETLKDTRWEEDQAVLDFTAPFFQGRVITPDELEALLNEEDIDMLIIAGKHAVGFFQEKGLIDEEDIIRISGIPYTSILFEDESEAHDLDDEEPSDEDLDDEDLFF